jgi:hypothetical protein
VPIIGAFITSEPNMLISRPKRRCAPQPSTSHLEPESGADALPDMLAGGEPVPQKSMEMGADDISKRTLDGARSWASNPNDNLDPDTSGQKVTKCLLCRRFYILSFIASWRECKVARMQFLLLGE